MSLVSKSLLLSIRTSTTRLMSRCFSSGLTKSAINSQYLKVAQPKLLPIRQTILARYSTETKQKIDEMVKSDDVVIFMKGTADQPMCGFSKAVVDILNMHGVQFKSFNVLSDEEIRSGIKEYSNWPTIPQIFFKGEFIGGCDILLEMHRGGELIDELSKIGIKSKLEED
ncbi:glutaredoxin-related mitochondrial [Brachionus plicatilis]|uniref:Glutaredoxin-related protein 5, mitochondrial n=1 Tax=Brachionus plicatilis TaxID=10195 RepID=A0A3M7SEY3_BRAPC|nr:glutaredoxin-related mitochondrial [Brachionus plicatilis]